MVGDNPDIGHWYPAGQKLHSREPESAYVPGRHLIGSAIVVGHLEPAGHNVQVDWFPIEYCPSTQVVMVGTCVYGQAYPAGQGVHLV